MINIIQLDECIEEAEKFITRAKQAKGRLLDEHCKPYETHFGNPQTAAVRRTSLDLTKSLSKLRKPR
jgi:hypothetical protein